MVAQTDDAAVLVRLRNEFYRDNYHRILVVLLIAFLTILFLIGALTYVVTHPPQAKYFATNRSGRIVPLVALDKPNLSKTAILQWANTAAVAAFTYNFVNYRQELQAASEFFTPTGWTAFIQSLNQSRNLAAVRAKNLVVSAVATGAPVILQEGVVSGRYSWRVQIPIIVTFQSGSQVTQQSLIVTMLIARISTLNSPRGIGIAQFIGTPSGTAQQFGV